MIPIKINENVLDFKMIKIPYCLILGVDNKLNWSTLGCLMLSLKLWLNTRLESYFILRFYKKDHSVIKKITCELLSERKQRFLLGSGLLVMLKGSV